MNSTGLFSTGTAVLICAAALQPVEVLACATCFGQSDSALAKGMNMGIMTLLAVLVVVLSCITGFFIFLARQSARTAAASSTASGPHEIVTRSEHD